MTLLVLHTFFYDHCMLLVSKNRWGDFKSGAVNNMVDSTNVDVHLQNLVIDPFDCVE